jgi:REP element-mobilizing transposase RayT
MRNQLFVHMVWTTRNRAPIIDARVAAFLDSFVRRIALTERAEVLEVGIVQTHVHLVVRIHPTTQLPRLVQRLKGGSAHFASAEVHAIRGRELRWEKGYSVHSVSPRALDIVRGYVRLQPNHHPTEAIPGWPHPSSSSPRLRPLRDTQAERRL